MKSQIAKSQAGAHSHLKRRLFRVLKALREERETRALLETRWKTLLTRVPTAILLLAPDATIQYANQQAAELLRCKTQDLVGLNARTLIAKQPLDCPLRADSIDSVLSATEAPVNTRVRMAASDGSACDVELDVTRLPEGSSFVYAVRLQKIPENETEQRSPAKPHEPPPRHSHEEILGTVCHELRTPLHGLIATLDLLRDEQLSEIGSQQLALAKASARSMLQLVTDVLDITRIASGGPFPLKLAPFSLEKLLHETVGQYNARASAKGIALWLIVSADRPSYFVGDRQRIKQIVSNLLTNAIKFTETGQVLVEATYVDGTVQIDVHDSGPGIPKNMQQAVFEPFVQASPQHGRQGTGLGLSISRRLSEAMGGRLELVESSPAGSTFRTTLPLPRADALPEAERNTKELIAPRGHILVVDDHPINLFVVRTMLESLKCSCALASSGKQALELIEAQDFDLILMDCRMPGMDGLETTIRVRQQLTRHVPIVAMTADVTVEKREKGRSAGMDDYLIKPFDRRELSRILRTWLKPSKAITDAVGQPAHSVVDHAVLIELWESVNWQTEPLRNIATGFKETIARCVTSFERGDPTDIRSHLHTVIGTGGMIGAMEIRSLAIQLQDAFKSGDATRVHELRTRLSEASERFERTLIERLESLD